MSGKHSLNPVDGPGRRSSRRRDGVHPALLNLRYLVPLVKNMDVLRIGLD